MTYYCDYPTEPMGGTNPYYRCVFCKKTDPQINGTLENHAEDCEYRIKKQNDIACEGFKTLWLLYVDAQKHLKYDENDLEDLCLRIINFQDNNELEHKVFEQLLEMGIGKATLIENKWVVKILGPC